MANRRFRQDSTRRIAADARGEPVMVLGLGRFGGGVAIELTKLGVEVLGIDDDEDRVQDLADDLTHVLQGDTTHEETLLQMGAKDFKVAVVAIGTDIEASVLTTAALADIGVSTIWAKAVTEQHGRILNRVGAHHVVFPEREMGQRVAHLVGGRLIDWFQLDADFALVETEAPAELVGRSLSEIGIRSRYDVTVVCVKPVGQGFTYATADTVLHEGDVLVVAGPTRKAEAFARQS